MGTSCADRVSSGQQPVAPLREEALSGSDYITGTNHSATLEAALEDFHRALTKRWREKVCEAIVAGSHDFPISFRRPMSGPSAPVLWEYWSWPARHHFGLHGDCAFVNWVNAGQEGSLSGVTCDGYTGVNPTRDEDGVDLVDPNGGMVRIPEYIDCGMGSILAQVEDWAWGERDHIFYQLPLFDSHDVGALQTAHNTFLKVGGALGLEASSGSNADASESFTAVDEREIPAIVGLISSKDADGQDWWAGWTGLAASRAGAGFFASVAPTLNNQSGILGSLANLYSDRAAIIEKGRNDSLYWIRWATESLGETITVTSDRTNGWKAVQGIGMGISVSGGWTGVGGAIGAGVTLVGFLGENLDDGSHTEAYKHEVAAVVNHLNLRVDELNTAINGYENDYSSAVTKLRTTLHSIHSYNLELYDLTANSPTGDAGGEPGYEVDVDSVLRLAENCYLCGEKYDGQLSSLKGTSQADAHLADKDGSPTAADKGVLEVRDQLEAFLKTSCGRYLVAGDQVKAAAEAYVEVDTSQEGVFDRTMTDWKDEEVGEYDPGYDPGGAADETGRSDYDPYEGHPALGGAEPGGGNGQEYEVEPA